MISKRIQDRLSTTPKCTPQKRRLVEIVFLLRSRLLCESQNCNRSDKMTNKRTFDQLLVGKKVFFEEITQSGPDAPSGYNISGCLTHPD